jgi:hypothetical protein
MLNVHPEGSAASNTTPRICAQAAIGKLIAGWRVTRAWPNVQNIVLQLTEALPHDQQCPPKKR